MSEKISELLATMIKVNELIEVLEEFKEDKNYYNMSADFLEFEKNWQLINKKENIKKRISVLDQQKEFVDQLEREDKQNPKNPADPSPQGPKVDVTSPNKNNDDVTGRVRSGADGDKIKNDTNGKDSQEILSFMKSE